MNNFVANTIIHHKGCNISKQFTSHLVHFLQESHNYLILIYYKYGIGHYQGQSVAIWHGSLAISGQVTASQ